MNSLNYISPMVEMVFSKRRVSVSNFVEDKRRPITTVGLAWGIQRNYPKHFSLDLNLGLGWLFTKVSLPDGNGQPYTDHTNEFTSIGQITLGFWLNKR